MHVHHHLRPFPLQPDVTRYAAPARKKKLDDPDKVPPVRGRFEDEQAAGGQSQNWRGQPSRDGESKPAEEESGFGGYQDQQRHGVPAPAESSESLPTAVVPTFAVDQLLAGVLAEAPLAGSEAFPGDDPAAPADASIDDLLALMRTK
jgi:hypothetical protein